MGPPAGISPARGDPLARPGGLDKGDGRRVKPGRRRRRGGGPADRSPAPPRTVSLRTVPAGRGRWRIRAR